jgi:curved DNA-binding protein CbpA
MTNHEILGIKPGATKEEIKKAYYKLAHIYHPDKGGDPKRFIEITKAYEALKNQSDTTGWVNHPYEVYTRQQWENARARHQKDLNEQLVKIMEEFARKYKIQQDIMNGKW